MPLPNDPGPGANPNRPPLPGPEYPPPLDLSVAHPGAPFMARSGPGFEWMLSEGRMKLVVLFAVAGGPVLHRVLEPQESAQLLEWLLAAASVGGK